MSEPNLKVIKRSRRPLAPGDIFAMQPPNGSYLFGRVIEVDLPRERAPMPGASLIYIYRTTAESPTPELSLLTRDDLLVPPIFTNRLGWTRGYFVSVAHRELTADDLLPQHCFRRWTGEYLDQFGKLRPGPVEPCGDWGLSSYRGIDDQVSDALGIPRVPE